MINKFICQDTYTQRDISFKVIPKFNAVTRQEDVEKKQNLMIAFCYGENIEESMYYQVSKFVKEHELEAAVEIIETEQGVAIQVRESILFETSKSTLREDSKEVLSSIAELLSSIDNTIVVEGHTDNRPISTAEFPSNWELSVDRAVNVVKYFVENTGIDPKRLSATGYGEHHPVVPNDTEENMAKNRRVNILIIADDKE